MSWLVLTKQTNCRDKARFKVVRITAELWHPSGARHFLHGWHGERILTETARLWNAAGRDCPSPTTCAADIQSAAGRAKYYLKNIR
jgi:hypothetical protein